MHIYILYYIHLFNQQRTLCARAFCSVFLLQAYIHIIRVYTYIRHIYIYNIHMYVYCVWSFFLLRCAHRTRSCNSFTALNCSQNMSLPGISFDLFPEIYTLLMVALFGRDHVTGNSCVPWRLQLDTHSRWGMVRMVTSQEGFMSYTYERVFIRGVAVT